MVIVGKSRGNGAQLGPYLMTLGGNENLRSIEIRGVAATNIPDALAEMDALALGAQTEKGLYHASIKTPADERLTDEQMSIAVDRLEAKLGLTGQPRVVVLHEKKGRLHCHIVWSRIDLERMAAISDSNNYPKHEEVARELEREFGLRRVPGAHAERENKQRAGLSPEDAREQITELWFRAESGRAFAKALDENGWILARGTRRDFVVIDLLGGAHNLVRRIDGAKTADVRARMADIDSKTLPTVDQAKDIQWERAHGVRPLREELDWEDKLGAAGKARLDWGDRREIRISEKLVERDLAWHQKQAARPATRAERTLMEAYEKTRTPEEFVARFDQAGFTLARATGADIEQLQKERAVHFAAGRPGAELPFRRELKRDELVIVDRFANIRRLNAHKIDTALIAAHYTQGARREPGSVVEARDKALANRPPERDRTPPVEPRRVADRAATEPSAPPGRVAEGLAQALATGLGGIAGIFEHAAESPETKERRKAEDAKIKAAKPTSAEIRETQSAENVRRDEEDRNKRREELAQRFEQDLETERDPDLGRSRVRDRDRSR